MYFFLFVCINTIKVQECLVSSKIGHHFDHFDHENISDTNLPINVSNNDIQEYLNIKSFRLVYYTSCLYYYD